LFPSLVRSRQVPEQLLSPPPQLVVHAPLAQIWPPAQVTPQAPQLFRSFCVSTQALLQLVPPLAQSSTQAPVRHT
jgi:hypothetical protein